MIFVDFLFFFRLVAVLRGMGLSRLTDAFLYFLYQFVFKGHSKNKMNL